MSSLSFLFYFYILHVELLNGSVIYSHMIEYDIPQFTQYNIQNGQNKQNYKSPHFYLIDKTVILDDILIAGLEMLLDFIPDICSSYASVSVLFAERFCLQLCQNWLSRGDTRNTSLISFVNSSLRVGSHSIDRWGSPGIMLSPLTH